MVSAIISGIISGLIVGFILSMFGVEDILINFCTDYLHIKADETLYYVICIVIGILSFVL